MVGNWINIEPTQTAEITKEGIIEHILCKIKFQGTVEIILEDDDVEYLIKELSKFKESKKMMEKICCG